MNRTALSVVGLAVGAVLIIGLFNIYKPAVRHLANDVFQKVHIGAMEPLPEHKFDGLTYTDDHQGNVVLTGGTLKNKDLDLYGNSNWPNQGLLASPDAPQAFKNAKTIKVSNSVDVGHMRDLRGIFAFSNNLQSIDLGNNFDVSKMPMSESIWSKGQWGLDSMFQGDSNLEHVNLGSGFKINPDTDKNANTGKLWNMFLGDNKLNSLTGNIPAPVQKAYENRSHNYYD